MTEMELRELLKLIRGVEHYIEKCLRSEQEKNEERAKKHLKAQGIEIEETATQSLNKTETSEFEF